MYLYGGVQIFRFLRLQGGRVSFLDSGSRCELHLPFRNFIDREGAILAEFSLQCS